MKTSIGDLITTELAAKLPYKLLQRREIIDLPPDKYISIKESFQNIENVRPFEAIVEWLIWTVKENQEVMNVIDDVVEEVIGEFDKLLFVRDWYARHDHLCPWEDLDKFQLLLKGLRYLKLQQVESVFPLLAKLKELYSVDRHAQAAARESEHLDPQLQYIVYGHTHAPEQKALRVLKTDEGNCEYVYLNTGTWRINFEKSLSQLSFMGWKNLTYLVFYKKEERKSAFPVFESWTGALKTV